MYLTDRLLAISNHGQMLGGGEHSFFDLLAHLPLNWQPLAIVPEEGDLASRLRDRGIETLVRPLPQIRPWLITKVLHAISRYTTLFQRYHPSLVYANGSRAAFYGGLACRLYNIPLLWHCRIADRDPALDLLLCTLSSKIIVNSKATAQRFWRAFGNKTRVVYNFLDIKWLQSGSFPKPDLIDNNWKVILVVARASKEKRHDVLLSAFENIAANDSTVHLVCLGGIDHLDLPWWQHLQSRTSASPFSNRIHWVGHVDDVRPWYRSAHFLALGSETESFGRVLVEAMASGLPVIATRAGGIPEIIRDGQDGLLVTPGSITEMAEGFSRLLKVDSLRQRFIESGLERAQLFDMKTHISQMITIFEACTRKGGTSQGRS